MGSMTRNRRALTLPETRALALTAQGFGARNSSTITKARALKALQRIAPLQIDSVNVLVRAHYMPLFSRIGAYDRTMLDRLAYKERRLFEYWGHMASYMPVEQFRLMRWKMSSARASAPWKALTEAVQKHRSYIEDVYAEVRDRGPIAASELSAPGTKSGPWWGWATGKLVMEWLFLQGRITAADRRNFERVYDITERVIPAVHLEAPAPDEQSARRELILYAARALGVATANDLFDYFRLNRPKSRPTLAEVELAGELERVSVDGWKDPAFVLPGTRAARPPGATALLSPFDSLIWDRSRTERLFGFQYRIEIYVPAPKRVHGYYVLPFLHDDRLTARVDLKADRKAGTLLVPSAFVEPGTDRGAVAEALAPELVRMAGWLGLGDIRIGKRGDLSRSLSSAVRRA
jgi:hypothetical protein